MRYADMQLVVESVHGKKKSRAPNWSVGEMVCAAVIRLAQPIYVH